MRGATASSRQIGGERFCVRTVWLAGVAYGAYLLVSPAAAFPTTDPSNASLMTAGSDLGSAAASDTSDATALAHQMQLLGPFGATVGPGWTFTPSLTLQEALNDNVFETQSNRSWDLISYLTPGLIVTANTQDVQLRLNYQPTLEYYARNTSQNQLAQNLNAIGNVTLWQDHLYLDVRAAAGVGSTSGSMPGLGYGTTSSGQPNSGITGLTKQNSTQYTSFAVSPYFLQQFDTYGTLKLGYTLSHTTTSNAGGFVPLPTNSTGTSASQTTNEEFAQFTSGTFLERATDTVAIDATQYQGTGAATSGYNETATNTVNYVVNREIAVFGSFGYENINYGGTDPLVITGPTWQIGATLTPNPKSTLTMSYGRQQGEDSLTVNGVYQATTRTSINISYGQQLGTELQSLENQLASGNLNNPGINPRTGQPFTNGNNLLGIPTGLYRSETMTAGTSTLLNRDTFTFNVQYAKYTAAGAGATGSTNGFTGTANWNHAIRDYLMLNVSASYGQRWFTDPGGANTFAAATASLQYLISATVSTTLSYAFYDLNSTQQGQSFYQDILLLSLTKQF